MKHQVGAAALLCTGVSVALLLTTGLLGTSAAQPPLPGGPGWLPPYHLGSAASPWLVTGLLLAAALLGAAGVGLGLWGLRRGWRPDPGRLMWAGGLSALATVLVPPMGSADHLVYAAYGRLAATGGNPYTQTAADLARSGDPVGRAVEAPWTRTPSVYGPVATGEQWLASRIGGSSVHTTVFVLTVLGAIAFVVTGLLLLRMAGPDPASRARVALMWSLNPLLLFVAVNAGHADTLAIVFAVASLWVLRRSVVAAGVFVGLACAVKVSLGLYVLALAWGLRRRPRELALLAGTALAVGVLAYAPVGTDAFAQMRKNSSLVSLAVPLRELVHPLESALGHGTARTVVSLLGWLLMAAVVWLLAPRVMRSAEVVPGPGPVRDAVGAAALLSVAWLLTAPYSLPWYDVVAWAPVALLAAGAVDGVLLVRTAMLVCAYVPGRVVPLPGALKGMTDSLRGTVAPWVGIMLLAAVVWLCTGARRQASD